MHVAPLADSGGGQHGGGGGSGGASSRKKAGDLLLGKGIALAVCLATASDHGGGSSGGGSSSGTTTASCESASALTLHGGIAPPSGGSEAVSGVSRNVTTRADIKKRQRELARMSTVGGRIEDRFELGDQLGEGGYGTVHMGTDRRTGAVVAVKVMQKKHMGKASFAKEVATLRKIHDAGGHPNIAGVEAIYEDRSNYYLVLELVSGGEMFEHLVRNGAYSEQTAAALVRDLAQGLLFLHSHDIVHADLKPENVMLSSWDDQTAQVKLVDFGCAGTTGERWDATATGTTAYWPPEAMSNSGFELTPAMDMWSVGVILYIMLTGMHPYDVSGETPEDVIMAMVASEDVPMTDDVVGHLSESAKDLIARLMARDPARRLTAKQMAEHPWVMGETASEATIDKIDEKLATYRQTLEDKILGTVFSMLVQRSVSVSSNPLAMVATAAQARAPDSLEDAVDVVKKAFSVFDKEKKGYVNATDIARVLSEVGEGELTEQESADVAQALQQAPGDGSQGISISSFEEITSCLGRVKYKAGDYIFREGEAGDYMYFINSGRVEVFKEGKEKNEPCRITTLGAGDLFGEASLMTKDPRSASVKCITPVQVVRLSRDSVERIMKDAKGAGASLREMAVLREMNRAKAVLRAVGRVVQKSYRPGEVVVQQGDNGKSMFTIVQGDMDVLMTPRRPSGGGKSPRGRPVKVASIGPGDIFGEMALMLEQPRNASVVCRGSGDGGGGCLVKEIQGDDFLQLLRQSPDFHKAMRCLMRTRQFRHDILCLGNQIGVGEQSFSEAELRRVFQEVDQDGSGLITAAELTAALDRLGSKMTAEDVNELLRMGDLRLEGGISFDEFCRVMAWAAS